MKRIEKWDDINCHAEIEIDSDVPTMKFSVFEVAATSMDEKGNKVPYYKRKEATGGMDMTENLEEAQALLSGYIKWDACSHVTFGDENGYIHLCGGISWFNLIESIKRIWEIARKTLPEEHSTSMFDLELFK